MEQLQSFSAPLPRQGYVRESTLVQVIPFSRATLWRWSKRGDFPRPYKISEGITAWKCEDVWNWLESRKQVGGQKAA